MYELGAIAEYIHHTVISSLEVKQLDDQSGTLSTLFISYGAIIANIKICLSEQRILELLAVQKTRGTLTFVKSLKGITFFFGGGGRRCRSNRFKVQYQFKSHQENDKEGRSLISIPWKVVNLLARAGPQPSHSVDDTELVSLLFFWFKLPREFFNAAIRHSN